MMDVVILIETASCEAVALPIDERVVVYALDGLLQRAGLERDVLYRQFHSVNDVFEIPKVTIDSKTFVSCYAVD